MVAALAVVVEEEGEVLVAALVIVDEEEEGAVLVAVVVVCVLAMMLEDSLCTNSVLDPSPNSSVRRRLVRLLADMVRGNFLLLGIFSKKTLEKTFL